MKSLLQLIGVTLLGLVLSSCVGNGDDTSTNTLDDSSLTPQQIDVGASHQYWNGGEFEGQPVYSLTKGVSQAAHTAFVACGLDDSVLETLVSYYLEHGTERQVLLAGDTESEPLWEVVMTVESMTPDIYLVTCSGVRP